MAITPREKELAAVGISAAAGCKPCTDHHVRMARKARASDEEIGRAVADALGVRKGATEIMADHALAQLGREPQRAPAGGPGETNRVEALVRLGAAFAVNCTSSLEAQLAAARAAGISQADMAGIVELAAYIKKRATFHVERLAGISEEAAA